MLAYVHVNGKHDQFHYSHKYQLHVGHLTQDCTHRNKRRSNSDVGIKKAEKFCMKKKYMMKKCLITIALLTLMINIIN